MLLDRSLYAQKIKNSRPNPHVFSRSAWNSSCKQVLQFCVHTFLPAEQWPSPFNSHLHLPSNHTLSSATWQFFSAVTVYSCGKSSISDSEPNHISLQKLTLHPFPSLNFTPDANASVWLSSECPKDRISLHHYDWDLIGTSQSAFITAAFKSPYPAN